MKNILVLLSCFISFTLSAQAQEQEVESPLSFSGYLEAYYLYDFGNPGNHNRSDFVYSFNRHNEFTLNLALIKGSYTTDKVRANLGLMTGTYANANLSAEPGVLKNVFEANVGLKLSEEKDLWLDAGIFPSHIGFESAIGQNCWNLTRSILADNSPYYESGVKVSYTSDDGRWFLSGLILNGWQRIQRVDGNQTPGFGHQITFTPNERITLNSSSFIGNDKPDNQKQMRYFHNLYSIFQVSPAVGITIGFDIGTEEAPEGAEESNTWYSPVAIVQFALSEKISLAARSEYYSDKSGVIIATDTPNGFQTFGYSANLDYQVSDEVLWRVEARNFNSEDEVFENGDGDPTKNNFFVATSLSVSF